MSDAEAKEKLALSLSQHVFENLELWAASAQLDFGSVVESALVDYFAIVERCDPDIRALVRVLVALPIERQ